MLLHPVYTNDAYTPIILVVLFRHLTTVLSCALKGKHMLKTVILCYERSERVLWGLVAKYGTSHPDGLTPVEQMGIVKKEYTTS